MNFKEKFQLLQEHNEQFLPKIFNALKKATHPLAGVHFTTIKHVSPNPNPTHHDPIGVYAFPKEYVFKQQLKNNIGFVKFGNVFVIEPSEDALILNLDMDDKRVIQLMDLMGIPKEYFDDTRIYHNSLKKGEAVNGGFKLWGIMEKYRHDNNMAKNSSWNALFRKTDYNVIYDPGLGIIHSNEKSQIIYFNSKAFKVLDTFKEMSNILPYVIKQFPDFKPKIGKKYGEKYLYLEKKVDDISMMISVYQNNNDPKDFRLQTVGEEGNGFDLSSWSYDYDIDKMIALLKEHLKTAKFKVYSSSSEWDKVNDFIQQISKKYNLYIKPGAHLINRTYYEKGDMTYPIRFELSCNHTSTGEYISMSLQKQKSYGWQNYFFHTAKTYKIDTDVEKVVIDIFSKLEEQIKYELQRVETYGQGTSAAFIPEKRAQTDSALNTLAFIKRRVFRIK